MTTARATYPGIHRFWGTFLVAFAILIGLGSFRLTDWQSWHWCIVVLLLMPGLLLNDRALGRTALGYSLLVASLILAISLALLHGDSRSFNLMAAFGVAGTALVFGGERLSGETIRVAGLRAVCATMLRAIGYIYTVIGGATLLLGIGVFAVISGEVLFGLYYGIASKAWREIDQWLPSVAISAGSQTLIVPKVVLGIFSVSAVFISGLMTGLRLNEDADRLWKWSCDIGTGDKGE